MRLNILGIGSPFGADRIAWEVVEALGARHPQGRYACGELRIDCCDRPGVALLEQLHDCDEAWIVDALSGGEAGRVRWLVAEDLAVSGDFVSTHRTGVAEALTLGAALNEPLPTVKILAIEIGDLPGESASTICLRSALSALSMRIGETLGAPE